MTKLYKPKKRCFQCKGTGRVRGSVNPPDFFERWEVCPICKGKGETKYA